MCDTPNGNGMQQVKKVEQKIASPIEQQKNKIGQPVPGFVPEKETALEFAGTLQMQQENLHIVNQQVKKEKQQLQPAQPVFLNLEATMNLQQRLMAGERSKSKSERRKAAAKKDRVYEREQHVKDQEKYEDLIKLQNETKDAFQRGVLNNEISIIGGMLNKSDVRKDMTGRQRRKNQEKYAATNVNKEKIRLSAAQDAENLARNLHLDVMFELKVEVPEELQKYNDAHYFTGKYGENVIRKNFEAKNKAEKEIEQNQEKIVLLQNALKGLERAQEPDEEIKKAIAEHRTQIEKLQAANKKLEEDMKEYTRARAQVADLVLYLKGAATNGGAMLTQVAREIKALQLAYDQIEQEGASGYNELMLKHLQGKIREKQAFYEDSINAYDTCNGTITSAKGAAIMKAQSELTAIRKEMLKVQENGEAEEKLEELEKQALEIIEKFAYDVPEAEPQDVKEEEKVQPLPKVFVKERADLHFKREGASYYLQKKYLADERSEEKAVRQQAAETVNDDEQKLQRSARVVMATIEKTIATKDELEVKRFNWLTDQKDQKLKQEIRIKEEIKAEVQKEKGQEMKFTVMPEDLKEVPVPPEHKDFLSFEESITHQVRVSEKRIYYRYASRKDISGKLRRENEKKYRKTDAAKQEVKEAAAQDVENLVNNLRADSILDGDFSLEADLQQFADIYYFTRQHGEDAVLNNRILRTRQEAQLLRLQLEKNKDTPAEEVQKVQAELKRLEANQKVVESFSLAVKVMMVGVMEANQNARMIRAMTTARQMIVEEGDSNYHAEMLRQLDEKIKTAQIQYDEDYENLCTLNHKTDATNKAILETWNKLLEIGRRLRTPGLTDAQKEWIENEARTLIYNFHSEETAPAN